MGESLPVYIGTNKVDLIEQAYALNAQVYSVISRIAVRASTIPRVLYKVNDAQKAQKFRELKYADKIQFKSFLKTKALSEIDQHQILDTLNKPNAFTTGQELTEGAITFLIATGDAFLYGFTPGSSSINAGKQIELVLLPSQYTQAIAGDPLISPIKGYKLVYDEEIILDIKRVTHIKHFNPLYSSNGQQLYGFSPLQAGRRTITESNAGYNTAISYYQNNGVRGVLTRKDTAQSQTMSPLEAERLQNLYDQRYTGDKKAGKIIVTAASVDWKAIGLSPVDLNINVSRQYTMRDICNLLHFPSQMMNDIENQNYATMKEARKAMVTDAVLPKLDKLNTGLNNGFVASHNSATEKLMLHYNQDAIPELQADLEMMVNQLNTAWWLTPNEKRFAMGYEEDSLTPEFNSYYIPSNIVSMSDLEVTEEGEEVVKRMISDVRKYGDL